VDAKQDAKKLLMEWSFQISCLIIIFFGLRINFDFITLQFNLLIL